MSLSTLIRFFCKIRTLKWLSVILLIGICLVGYGFAQDTKTDTISITQINDSPSNLIGVFSRVWVWLAIIAGKLMTNDAVYGSFMHLDVMLWKIWNVMKNFANFGLITLILIGIIKHLLSKGKGATPQTLITKALVAGILIQASWFLTGAAIDLSTVVTAAISGFPSAFIGSSELNGTAENNKTDVAQKFVAKIENGRIQKWDTEPANTDSCQVEVGDEIYLPKYDSVSGPLIFIGSSALRINSYLDAKTLNDNSYGALAINFSLKVVVLLFFVLVLALLVIANLIRILFLWILILGSPIFILIALMDEKLLEGGGSKGITQYLNLATFFDLIFRPVFFVGFLSLMLIFIVSMQKIMGNAGAISDLNGVSFTTTGGSSQVAIKDLATFDFNSQIFTTVTDETKNVFVDLLMFLLTIFLLWYLLKLSITFGKGPVKDVMEKIAPLIEDMAKNLPVVPTGGGDKMGVGGFLKAKEEMRRKTLEGFGLNTEGKFYKNEEAFESKVNEMMGMQRGWQENDYKVLTSLAEKGDVNFWEKLKETGSEVQSGVSLSNPRIASIVEKWIQKNANTKPNFSQDNKNLKWDGVTATTKLDDFLKIAPDNAYVIHQLLGGDAATGGVKGTNITADDVKKNSYYVGR